MMPPEDGHTPQSSEAEIANTVTDDDGASEQDDLSADVANDTPDGDNENATWQIDSVADDDDTLTLSDITPRERADSTARSLNLPHRRHFFAHSQPDAARDDEWDDVDWDGADDDETPESDPGAEEDESAQTRRHALVPTPTTARLPAIDLSAEPRAVVASSEENPPATPIVIPGARRLRRPPKNPFIKRRARPLAVGLLTFTIIAALVFSGLLITTPLGATLAANASNPLASSAGVANQSNGVQFIWYTAQWGDTPESLAQKFKVALGGIYELNNLDAGAELAVGFAYKIPVDPNYGQSYTPPAMLNVSANYGNTRFGPNWWNSIAGAPPSNSLCAPNGGANLLGYDLQPPNWGARWVRGFIVYGTWVYHTGVDLAAPQGNPIHAAQAGQVIWAGYDGTNGLGWSVKIDNCNHVSTVYGHMLRLLVHTGEFVDVGTPVGLEGSTGNSTGPHLHFMVEWNNLWVDPMLFYASHAAIIGPPNS
jgi:murein DD-endopeptidase MepM/ murein hydrolase activator NlpD